MHIIFIQPKVLKILTVKLHTTGIKHCQYICTKYSHKFQQNRLIFLLGANRPGAKRLGGRNDQGRNDLERNAAGAKRLGGELDLGRNDPDSQYHTADKGSNSKWNRLHIKTKLYRSLEHFFPHVLDYFVYIEGLYITYHEII